jgi:hypothetical protein
VPYHLKHSIHSPGESRQAVSLSCDQVWTGKIPPADITCQISKLTALGPGETQVQENHRPGRAVVPTATRYNKASLKSLKQEHTSSYKTSTRATPGPDSPALQPSPKLHGSRSGASIKQHSASIGENAPGTLSSPASWVSHANSPAGYRPIPEAKAQPLST